MTVRAPRSALRLAELAVRRAVQDVVGDAQDGVEIAILVAIGVPDRRLERRKLGSGQPEDELGIARPAQDQFVRQAPSLQEICPWAGK
jgi:hypothetical protein